MLRMLTLAATAALLGGGAQAQAIPIPLTGGLIVVSVVRDFSPIVSLDGPGFHFDSTDPFNTFMFTSEPNPAIHVLPYGTEIELSGLATLFGAGSITLTTPRVVVASLLSIPFSLSGTLQGQEVFGSGIVTARLEDHGAPGLPDTPFSRLTARLMRSRLQSLARCSC